MAAKVARAGGRIGSRRPRGGKRKAARRGRERLSPARNLRTWIGAWKFEPREYQKIQKLLYELRHAE